MFIQANWHTIIERQRNGVEWHMNKLATKLIEDCYNESDIDNKDQIQFVQNKFTTSPNYSSELKPKTATRSRSFKAFHFAFVPKISKIDQAIFDSFSGYDRIAVHTMCSFSHNF